MERYSWCLSRLFFAEERDMLIWIKKASVYLKVLKKCVKSVSFKNIRDSIEEIVLNFYKNCVKRVRNGDIGQCDFGITALYAWSI